MTAEIIAPIMCKSSPAATGVGIYPTEDWPVVAKSGVLAASVRNAQIKISAA
jgi:hypothetical protein